jgi:hypothetical protein
MRQAWSSLRERLGLHRNNTSNAGAALATGTTGVRTDPREAMLSEMARAFNMGLGIDQAGPNAEERDAAGDGGAGRDLPPEDSFERFLIDLQADLRVTLSGNGEGDSVSPSSPTADLTPGDVAESTLVSTSEPTPLLEVPNVVTDEIVETPDDFDDMPPLRDVSDSSDDEDNTDTDEEALLERETTPVAAANVTTGSASRTERSPDGGINWWRLFRFPPISTTQAQGMSASLNASGNAAATNLAEGGARAPAPPAPIPQVQPGPLSTLEQDQTPDIRTSSSGPAAATASPSQPSAGDNQSNIVIPVILVGLRSVNINQRHQPEPLQPGQTQHPEHTTPLTTAGPDDGADGDDLDGFPPLQGDANRTGNGIGETGRGRRWGERAANAFRTLRNGRREPDSAQPGDGTGSRTFLIYVIGGRRHGASFVTWHCQLILHIYYRILST